KSYGGEVISLEKKSMHHQPNWHHHHPWPTTMNMAPVTVWWSATCFIQCEKAS
ncbi:hypothetical protein GCK32_021876, partial [Trichostrongylus colubriformis]